MIKGRTGETGDLEFVDDADGSTVAAVTTDGLTGAVPQTAAQTPATAITPGTATDVQGILAELAARITTLETP